nr:MAG TPA: hypothetical protein [Caudoviricetes sp.]
MVEHHILHYLINLQLSSFQTVYRRYLSRLLWIEYGSTISRSTLTILYQYI